MQKVNIIWFRRDLRLEDNQAVFEAVQAGEAILPIFIIDPYFYSWPEVGQKRVRFMFESLQNLHLNLLKLGSELVILEGNSVEILSNLQKLLLSNNFRPNLYFNADVQTEYGKIRDLEVQTNWEKNHPNSLHIKRAYFLQLQERTDNWHQEYIAYQNGPAFSHPNNVKTDSEIVKLAKKLSNLTLAELKTKYQQFSAKTQNLFNGGENEAHNVLKSFLDGRFEGYHWKLSRPYLAQLGSTSQLSPHIMFGTISPRQVWQATRTKLEFATSPKSKMSLNAFLDRLRWRDSFTQRFWFHAEYTWQNRFPEFNALHNPERQLTDQEIEYFERWKIGTTGFVLVDASMRQLREQGWLNFRMRAMVATFLTINCNVPWQLGARHFMNNLVDGDMCINAWQWQMQAGITNPLSPSFRIYDPNKNLATKDQDLNYTYFWVPELTGCNLNQILQGEYVSSIYPRPMLNFLETKKINGGIVSNLRKIVRTRVSEKLGIVKLAPKIRTKPKLITKKADTRQIDLFNEGNE